MNRFSSLLVAVAAVATGIAGAHAAQIYSCTFDGANGNSINGVTGGTATLNSTGNGTATVETANSMGDGGYYHMVQNVGDGNVKTTFAPLAANSMNAWLSAGGTALNGGFDFFMRPTVNMNGSNNVLPMFVDPPTGGVGLALGGGWNSTHYLNLLGQASNTFTNVTNVVGSNYTNDTNLKCGNLTTQDLAAGQVYHIAAAFSTDGAGLVTAKFFILPGTGAIDTSSTTVMTGEVTFNVNAPGGLSTDPIVFGNKWGGNAPVTVDYDSFRLYDSAPASFDGIAGVPEPTVLALLGLAAPMGLLRRRRA